MYNRLLTDLKRTRDALAKKLDAIKTDVTSVNNSVTNLPSTLDTKFSALTSKVDGVKTDVASVGGKVDSVGSALGGKIDNAQTTITSKVDAVGANVTAMGAKVDAVDANVTSMGAKVDASVGTIAGLNNAIETASLGISPKTAHNKFFFAQRSGSDSPSDTPKELLRIVGKGEICGFYFRANTTHLTCHLTVDGKEFIRDGGRCWFVCAGDAIRYAQTASQGFTEEYVSVCGYIDRRFERIEPKKLFNNLDNAIEGLVPADKQTQFPNMLDGSINISLNTIKFERELKLEFTYGISNDWRVELVYRLDQ